MYNPFDANLKKYFSFLLKLYFIKNRLLCTIFPHFKKWFVHRKVKFIRTLSPKFKKVWLNETPEFPFWGLKIYVDFDLRDSKKMESISKQKKNNISLQKY